MKILQNPTPPEEPIKPASLPKFEVVLPPAPMPPPLPPVEPAPKPAPPVKEDATKKEFEIATAQLENALKTRADAMRQELTAALKSLTTSAPAAVPTTASPAQQSLWQNDMATLRGELGKQMAAIEDQLKNAHRAVTDVSSRQEGTIIQLSEDVSLFARKLEALREEMAALPRLVVAPPPAPEPMRPIEPAPEPFSPEPSPVSMAPLPPFEPSQEDIADYLADLPPEPKSAFRRFWDYLNGTAVDIPIGRRHGDD